MNTRVRALRLHDVDDCGVRRRGWRGKNARSHRRTIRAFSFQAKHDNSDVSPLYGGVRKLELERRVDKRSGRG